jgi:undecaprenyl diphosphate synthase
MDGNGRWAKARGLPRSEGHKAGTEAAKAIITRCRELGIGHLTLYAFSKENWGRPRDEVSFLFDLLMRFLKDEQKSLLDQSIQLRFLGELADLPFPVRMAASRVVKKTAGGTGMILNMAINYSGRAEIVRAMREMLRRGIKPEEIDEERISDFLYTAGQPDPDFIIRTSGELRLSNYLLYQAAYAELYFTPVPWPDFSPDELDKALAHYTARQRRFGLTGEQVAKPE